LKQTITRKHQTHSRRYAFKAGDLQI